MGDYSRRGGQEGGKCGREMWCRISMPRLMQGREYDRMIKARGVKWYPRPKPSEKG